MKINKAAIEEHKWNIDQCKYAAEKVYLEFMNNHTLNRYSATEAYYYNLIPEENRTDDRDEATILLYMTWGAEFHKNYTISDAHSNNIKHTIPTCIVTCDLTVFNNCGAYKGTKTDKYQMYSEHVPGRDPVLEEVYSTKISQNKVPKIVLGSFDEGILYEKIKWILEQFDITINERGHIDRGKNRSEPELFADDLYYQMLDKDNEIKNKYTQQNKAETGGGGCKKGCLWTLIGTAGFVLFLIVLNVIFQANETIGKILLWGIFLSIVPGLVYLINFKKTKKTIPITSKEEFIKDLKRKFPHPNSGYPMYSSVREFWINTEVVSDSLATIQFQDRKPTEVHIEQNNITIHEAVGNTYQSYIFGNFKSVASIKKHKSFTEYINKIAHYKNEPENKSAVAIFSKIVGESILGYHSSPPNIDSEQMSFIYRHSELSITYLLIACFANYSKMYYEFYFLLQRALVENRYDNLLSEVQVESIKIHMKEMREHLLEGSLLDSEYMDKIRPASMDKYW